MKKLLTATSLLIMTLCMHSYAHAVQDPEEPRLLQESLELHPNDAVLFMADSVIVEPAEAPYNLGGWRVGEYVTFVLDVEHEGVYDVGLVYSKQAQDGSTAPFGIIAATELTEENLAKGSSLVVDLPMTGNDWSNYTGEHLGSLRLPEGEVALILGALPSEQERGEYVMNLRRLVLKRQQVDIERQMKQIIDDAFTNLHDTVN